VKVYTKCDYTHLNDNSLVSQKKMGTKGVILKGVYCTKLNGFGIHVRHHLLGTPLGS
jgi:hypothetical protein